MKASKCSIVFVYLLLIRSARKRGCGNKLDNGRNLWQAVFSERNGYSERSHAFHCVIRDFLTILNQAFLITLNINLSFKIHQFFHWNRLAILFKKFNSVSSAPCLTVPNQQLLVPFSYQFNHYRLQLSIVLSLLSLLPMPQTEILGLPALPTWNCKLKNR